MLGGDGLDSRLEGGAAPRKAKGASSSKESMTRRFFATQTHPKQAHSQGTFLTSLTHTQEGKKRRSKGSQTRAALPRLNAALLLHLASLVLLALSFLCTNYRRQHHHPHKLTQAMPPQGDNEEEDFSSSSSSNSSSSGSESEEEAVTVPVRKGKPSSTSALPPSLPPAGHPQATPAHVHYCFEVLLHHFGDGPLPVPTFDTTVECPLFVTWEKEVVVRGGRGGGGGGARGGHRQLRGCIGTLSPKSLGSLKEYVYSSAFKDRRFSPIASHELSMLACSVSLLVAYEEVGKGNVMDWEVGVHGIIIVFQDGVGREARHFSATYLPEVAREQGWSRREALESLVRKSGYGGRMDKEGFWEGVALTRYRSSKFCLTYEEFVEGREGGREGGSKKKVVVT